MVITPHPITLTLRRAVSAPKALRVTRSPVLRRISYFRSQTHAHTTAASQVLAGTQKGSGDLSNSTTVPAANRTASLVLQLGSSVPDGETQVMVFANISQGTGVGDSTGAVIEPRYGAIFLSVRGVSEVGLGSLRSSARLVLDSTPPESVAETPWVKDGVVVKYDVTVSGQQVRCQLVRGVACGVSSVIW